MGDWLEEAVYCWLQEAQEEAKVFRLVHGYYSDDRTWMTLTPPMKIPAKVGIGREAGAEPPGEQKQRGVQRCSPNQSHIDHRGAWACS